MGHLGGKLLLFQAGLPSLGPGRLKPSRDNLSLYNTGGAAAVQMCWGSCRAAVWHPGCCCCVHLSCAHQGHHHSSCLLTHTAHPWHALLACYPAFHVYALPLTSWFSPPGKPQLWQTIEREAQLRNPEDAFFKRYAGEASSRQITLDVFLGTNGYADLASLSSIPRYTCGQVSGASR
jgi:hypothetical protein